MRHSSALPVTQGTPPTHNGNGTPSGGGGQYNGHGASSRARESGREPAFKVDVVNVNAGHAERLWVTNTPDGAPGHAGSEICLFSDKRSFGLHFMSLIGRVRPPFNDAATGVCLVVYAGGGGGALLHQKAQRLNDQKLIYVLRWGKGQPRLFIRPAPPSRRELKIGRLRLASERAAFSVARLALQTLY